jgi:hypothetical protein
MLGPIMESLNGKINYRKLDIDDEEDFAVRYKVRSVPTLVLIENGVEKNRLVGVHQSPEILDFTIVNLWVNFNQQNYLTVTLPSLDNGKQKLHIVDSYMVTQYLLE